MKTLAFLRRVFGGKFATKKIQVRRSHAARIDRLANADVGTLSTTSPAASTARHG
ncbi:hypothetical protein [Variovorax sp. R-27]|jgi:hypothetical protein|uniref:hypothetical protein n=1 Tax=Variovorax sp. R-27 TaxID=3404058 RepID=UPI003CF90EA6